MQSAIIGSNQAGQRLDKFLHKYLPNAGTGFLYKMLRKKNITLNGGKAEGFEILDEGDTVAFFFSDETFEKFAGRPAAAKAPLAGKASYCKISEYEKAYNSLEGIRVVYEDRHFLFLDKPAGVLTQKAEPGDSSLNEWMIGYLLQKDPGLAGELVAFRPSVCNRLDRNTSGIVLCGKTLAGLQFLGRCIKEGKVRKFYHTICAGEIREAERIQGYLSKDGKTNKVYAIGGKIPKTGSGQREGMAGDYIETGYVPLNRKRGYTYLSVELFTGKTHQIRAHLAAMGYPLIGDWKYGKETLNRRLKQEYGLGHQLLHAYRVVFPKIESGVGISLSGREITAPEPELFVRVKSALGL